ncbi:3-phosphoshikimate 1-carboxyvinyltransferase [Methanocella sp. CWC-04]|uniref:3-phosphoshikimate 1-carboxyvinyltransferase n=1 Tax=Methanooceanicella nereidis TaxID=2052831 RepID=A0AAP2RE27_9EURY|nr:3-phosphoshikimate 1-carboxyvinyltransferase [Methanocella sp. CWC-04]MCD1295966.1 3-phosphoshikimate 1-carboxyvinyltransferase [Methanocella sp. CWC-04]
MNAKVSKSEVWGSVEAPPSKSYTHRAIVIGSLGKYSKIQKPLLSADTLATVDACRALGAEIKVEGEEIEIAGVIGKPKVPDNVIDAKNSGTTLRLCMSMAALADGATVFTGDESLRKRPNKPLIKALNDLGAVCYSTRGTGTAPIVVHGVMEGGKISIDGGISSQFISSLLISCPFAKNETRIEIEGELKSRPYIEVTLEMLEKAGAQVATNFKEFVIPTEQEYDLRSYRIPGDFSSASYMVAAAAITGTKVTVNNLFESKQGDSAILEYLLDMGANVYWDTEKGSVTVEGGELHGIEIDASATPDLVPTLAVLGACAKGTTRIVNAEHVRFKETDRLKAMANELKEMGVDIIEKPDGLVIKGGMMRGAHVEGYDDHRIVMSLAIAGLVATGTTTITDADAINISYPGFFDDLKKLGAKVEF